MPTLAQQLGETAHASPLLRRARRLDLINGWDLLAVAVARGCRHYAGISPTRVEDPGVAELTNEELAVLLLLGEHQAEPFLLRVAAQLMRAAPMNPRQLAALAKRERCVRVLAYIAEAGLSHDPDGHSFWSEVRQVVGRQNPVPPGILPHWSRFAANPGKAKGGRMMEPVWIGANA